MRSVASTSRDCSMSMRMNWPRPSSRARFASASSSSMSRPRCVSFSATFARSSSAAIRSRISSYATTTVRSRVGSSTPSPSSVVFAYSPWSFRRRSTATHSSSVSPATKRPAPSRMPCLRTSRCTRVRVGGGEDRLPQRLVDRCVQLCASSQAWTSGTRSSRSVRWPCASSSQASQPGTRAASHSPWLPGRSGRRRPARSAPAGRSPPARSPTAATNARLSSIQPSPVSAMPCVMSACIQRGERARERRAVGVAEQRVEGLAEILGRRAEQLGAIALDRRAERLLAGEHEVELLDVVLAHAGEPVEAVGAPRRDAGEARRGASAARRRARRRRARAGRRRRCPTSRTARARARRRAPRRRPRPPRSSRPGFRVEPP